MITSKTLLWVSAFLVTSLATEIAGATACGEFKFESPIDNGVLLVHENVTVNITFSVRNTNCSNMTIGDILISRNDTSSGVFTPRCKIPRTCENLPTYNSCHCLDSPGFYSWSFVVRREDNVEWKWSMSNNAVQDALLKLKVIYPPLITKFEIEGYNSFIPKHKFVTVTCAWENGNPPSSVSLLDRHKTVLIMGNETGNISYTFSPVECKHAGLLRCESDRSEGNKSINMLIECPPEFVKKLSSNNNLDIGQNADVTFPFRSHTSNITSCQIKQMIQNRNVDKNKYLQVVLNCTTAVESASNLIHENKHCWYSVTGDPPDLNLTIHLRNLTREDSGLWHVIVSNDEGSDVIHIQVNIEGRSDSPIIPGNIHQGVIIGVVTPAVLIMIIMTYFITKVRRRSVTSPYQTTTPPRTESDKSSSKTSSYNEVDDLELTARIREEAESVEYTRPSPPTAHAHSTRSHAERLTAVPPEAVTIEQAARAQQPEYVEIENEVRPNGDDGYLVPAGQYASLNPATRSEEGHEYENLGSKPTEPSSTPGYSGLVKSTKREKHLYDRLKRETNQTVEAEEDEPAYAIALEQMPGPTFTKL